MTCLDGENFSSACAGCIWTGEGAGDGSDGHALFNHFAFDVDPKETVWIMGVHHEMQNLLDDAGWFAEFHDAGTVFLRKSQ